MMLVATSTSTSSPHRTLRRFNRVLDGILIAILDLRATTCANLVLRYPKHRSQPKAVPKPQPDNLPPTPSPSPPPLPTEADPLEEPVLNLKPPSLITYIEAPAPKTRGAHDAYPPIIPEDHPVWLHAHIRGGPPEEPLRSLMAPNQLKRWTKRHSPPNFSQCPNYRETFYDAYEESPIYNDRITGMTIEEIQEELESKGIPVEYDSDSDASEHILPDDFPNRTYEQLCESFSHQYDGGEYWEYG